MSDASVGIFAAIAFFSANILVYMVIKLIKTQIKKEQYILNFDSFMHAISMGSFFSLHEWVIIAIIAYLTGNIG